MGRKIADAGGGGDFPPTALIKTEGYMLKGTLLSKRLVKTQYGDRPVYSIKLGDATCDFMCEGHPVEPKEGDMIDLFAPTRLERQLVQVPFNSMVTITHVGMKKVGKGQPAHIFDVTVEDK